MKLFSSDTRKPVTILSAVSLILIILAASSFALAQQKVSRRFPAGKNVRFELKNVTGTSYEIHRWDDEHHFYKKIIVRDASFITPEEYTEKIAKFSLGDFTDMLSFQNMQVIEVFGDYNLDPYDVKKTPRLIIVSRKKGTEYKPEKGKQLYSDGRRTDPLM